MTDSAPSLSPLIHLVDDDAAVREGLSLLISTVGLRVQTWADPQSFMAGFDRASIGAIVLDVRMPGISGLTVLEQLLAQGVDQPVILLTGHGTVEMCRRAFKTGAAEFLEKPVDDEVLIEALQNAVRQHVRSRESRSRCASTLSSLTSLTRRSSLVGTETWVRTLEGVRYAMSRADGVRLDDRLEHKPLPCGQPHGGVQAAPASGKLPWL